MSSSYTRTTLGAQTLPGTTAFSWLDWPTRGTASRRVRARNLLLSRGSAPRRFRAKRLLLPRGIALRRSRARNLLSLRGVAHRRPRVALGILLGAVDWFGIETTPGSKAEGSFTYGIVVCARRPALRSQYGVTMLDAGHHQRHLRSGCVPCA